MNDRSPRIPPHIFWPGLVVALLCVSLTAAAITVVAAVGDASFAVESDYYDKALAWDEVVAQRERNTALGWSAEVLPGETDALGKRSLAVVLRDASGLPIEGAEVGLTLFHFTNKSAAQRVSLAAGSAPGQYSASVNMRRAGLWSVVLTVEASGERFTSEQTIELETR